MVIAMMYPCGPIRQRHPAAAVQAQPQATVAGSLTIGRPPVTIACTASQQVIAIA
jgi:hypothetical protein